jgi:phage regulator Rha-like protein
MSTLIIIKDGQLVTTTLTIAEGTKNSHDGVIKLVRKHRPDLEQFGLVRFEIRPRSAGQHGGGDIEYAVLNEQQSALIIAYMRNTEIVRSFKIALVKGFYEMRAKLTAPADPFAHIPAEHRALVALLCENAAIKAKQDELAAAQATQQDSIQRIEAKQSAIENGAAYFTVIGYGTWRGITFSLTDAAALGRRASTLSKAAGIAVDAVRDPRFGKVNSYHESMLEAALSGLHGGM